MKLAKHHWMLIGSILLIWTAAAVGMWRDSHYTKVGKAQFYVRKNHQLEPVVPVTLTVEQLEGGVEDASGVLTCDIYDHTYPVQMNGQDYMSHSTEFKCGHDRFLIRQIWFGGTN